MSLPREDGRRLDPALIGATLGLVGIGAIMIASSSIRLVEAEPLAFFYQHLGALAVGVMAMLIALHTPIDWWNRLSSFLLLAALALLIGVLIPGIGRTSNGAARWIDIGVIGLQASEPARLFIVIYLASYSVRQFRALQSSFNGLLRPVLLIGLASTLLLLEPDYGATVVLVAAGFGLLFVAGARLRDLLVTSACAGAALAVLAVSEPYRLQRFIGFLDPWADPLRTGYQAVNSEIAIGSGGLLGRGLGSGVQKLDYLPESHTDFSFAVLSEELGLLGASVVIALLALIVYRAIGLGLRAIKRDLPFHGLVGIGIGLIIGLQGVINIGVNTSLLPPTGLTLPLISFGRTSVVVTLFAVGLLFRIARELDDAVLPARGRA